MFRFSMFSYHSPPFPPFSAGYSQHQPLALISPFLLPFSSSFGLFNWSPPRGVGSLAISLLIFSYFSKNPPFFFYFRRFCLGCMVSQPGLLVYGCRLGFCFRFCVCVCVCGTLFVFRFCPLFRSCSSSFDSPVHAHVHALHAPVPMHHASTHTLSNSAAQTSQETVVAAAAVISPSRPVDFESKQQQQQMSRAIQK